MCFQQNNNQKPYGENAGIWVPLKGFRRDSALIWIWRGIIGSIGIGFNIMFVSLAAGTSFTKNHSSSNHNVMLEGNIFFPAFCSRSVDQIDTRPNNGCEATLSTTLI